MTDVNELKSPAVKRIAESAVQVADSYDSFEVTTQEQYVEGANDLKRIKAKISLLEEERFAITRPMDDAKKKVMAFFGAPGDRLTNAEKKVKKALVDYQDKEDRIAAEKARVEREKAERRAAQLREVARKADEKAAAKERARLAKLQEEADRKSAIELKRIEKEEAAAKAAINEEAIQRAKEQKEANERRRVVEQRRLHRERLEAEAERRERTARAESLEARAESQVSAPVAPATPNVKGISTSKVWDFEIVDKSKIPDQYKSVDEKKIRGVVKALKDDADIPGVRVFQKTQMTARK